MRRIKDSYHFDLWLQALSPSAELLDSYNSGQLDWNTYVQRFSEEVLENPGKTPDFEFLQKLVCKGTVTLLCHEKSDEKCHRRLLIEKIQNKFQGNEI
ncbi:MAG: DUF488 domain-containing protein [Synergistaceae bacterium]|jgi:uncharacterized protein YeaO (DUF488 family)|nr:DUF488 domain-containing protein [Synergistaceae bacterium]